MLGFRGHFSTKSRAYSTTLGALRDVRRAWRIGQAEAARTRAGLPVADENTTLVTASSWTYLSSGYRPGEELLAAQVRHEIQQARQAVTASRLRGSCGSDHRGDSRSAADARPRPGSPPRPRRARPAPPLRQWAINRGQLRPRPRGG